ncbi:sporulation peptidase YabG [Thalassobacillus pellis]|uniref:sporulation peptidase YabG n=1 Tax=Thalassobacillus pellis TaxID=748008 RepID=UPI001960261B|nr:sporulation peptidase YabG [Thalassobacillus pellis]MBM7555173.1 spore coat assembly protein [Thalassobacillus pellis]
MIVKGDLVTRESYNHDLLFRVQSVDGERTVLFGEDFRIEADAPLKDLKQVTGEEYKRHKRKVMDQEDYSYRLFRQDYQLLKEKRDHDSTEGYQVDNKYFQISPRVLHVDGDQLFLKKCVQLYQQLGIQVHGTHMGEKEMPLQISALVDKIQPDIIVITGHDSFSKNKGSIRDLRAYRHSKYFVETVREIRSKTPHLDQLVIFAGACQSHFESLIRAGANYASSPTRINIHALDPVYIVARIAYTSFMDKVNVREVLRNTLTGENGLGGVETRGLLRVGMPFPFHNDQDDDEEEENENDLSSEKI